MSTKNGSAASASHVVAAVGANERRSDPVDTLVREYGKQLLAEARTALGPEHEGEAQDVCQDLFVGLLEGCFAFRSHPDGPCGWLKSIVRALAAERAIERASSGAARLQVTHDPETNVGYVYLVDPARSGGSARCERALGGDVVFDLDERGRIIGIEILDAKRLLREEILQSSADCPGVTAAERGACA